MNITVSYSGILAKPVDMRGRVEALQAAISEMPQYEPETKHTFYGGMYCREVWRPAGAIVVGKIHKKEHFYLIVSGTVAITTDEGVKSVTGPYLICSKPGTKRAVYAETDALCMTFHVVSAATIEEAEIELVEDDDNSMFVIGNKIKTEVLT